MSKSEYPNQLLSYIDNTKTPTNVNMNNTMWLITHYAIKGEIVDWFLKNVKPEFFTTNLKDRYFFEVCFPLIVDAYGKDRVNQDFWE